MKNTIVNPDTKHWMLFHGGIACGISMAGVSFLPGQAFEMSENKCPDCQADYEKAKTVGDELKIRYRNRMNELANVKQPQQVACNYLESNRASNY